MLASDSATPPSPVWNEPWVPESTPNKQHGISCLCVARDSLRRCGVTCSAGLLISQCTSPLQHWCRFDSARQRPWSMRAAVVCACRPYVPVARALWYCPYSTVPAARAVFGAKKRLCPRACSCSTVPAALSLQHCSCSTIPAALSLQHCPCSTVPAALSFAVLSLQHCPCSPVPTALSLQSCPCSTVLAALSTQPCACCLLPVPLPLCTPHVPTALWSSGCPWSCQHLSVPVFQQH